MKHEKKMPKNEVLVIAPPSDTLQHVRDLLKALKVELDSEIDDLSSLPVTDGRMQLDNKYFSCQLKVQVHNSLTPQSEPDLKDRVDALIMYMVDDDVSSDSAQSSLNQWFQWACEDGKPCPEILILVTKEDYHNTISDATFKVYKKLFEKFPFIEHVLVPTEPELSLQERDRRESLFEEGELLGLDRIYEAISNHLWEGHVLKPNVDNNIGFRSTVSENAYQHDPTILTDMVDSYFDQGDDVGFLDVIHGLNALRDMCDGLPPGERHEMAARIAQTFADMDMMANEWEGDGEGYNTDSSDCEE